MGLKIDPLSCVCEGVRCLCCCTRVFMFVLFINSYSMIETKRNSYVLINAVSQSVMLICVVKCLFRNQCGLDNSCYLHLLHMQSVRTCLSLLSGMVKEIYSACQSPCYFPPPWPGRADVSSLPCFSPSAHALSCFLFKKFPFSLLETSITLREFLTSSTFLSATKRQPPWLMSPSCPI